MRFHLAQQFANDAAKTGQEYAQEGVKQGQKLGEQAFEVGKDTGEIFKVIEYLISSLIFS